MQRFGLCVSLVVICLFAPQVGATPVTFFVITEADPGVPTGNQFLRTYDSFNDLKSLNQSSVTQLGPHAFGTGVSFAGLTFDGVQYHVITEADPGVPTGNQFLRSYDSLNDLKNLNQSSVTQLGPHAFGTGVSFAGLTFDGVQYHVITEADPGVPTGNQFLRSYDSLSDLKNLNQSSVTQLGPHAFGTGVSFAGLTFDGTQYHVITEADPGVPTGNQFLRSYDSLNDLKNLNQSSVTQLGPNAFGTGVSFRALANTFPGVVSVPEPSGLLLILSGLVAVSGHRVFKRS